MTIRKIVSEQKNDILKFMKIPTKKLLPGFYRHYKHDINGKFGNYTYEVLGIGAHTEGDCRAEDANMAIYRALYFSPGGLNKKDLYYLRPLAMFMGTVTKNEQTFPRFTKVEDVEEIAKLEIIKKEMYGA